MSSGMLAAAFSLFALSSTHEYDTQKLSGKYGSEILIVEASFRIHFK